MITCDEFTSMITEYLDGRVPKGRAMGMWMHRMMCRRCRGYFRQINELIAFTGAHGDAPRMELDEEQKARLFKAFREHFDDPGSPPPDSL